MPRPPDRNLLKCRFCEFTVMRYRRYKNGKVHHGHEKLEDHVMNAHYFAGKTTAEYGPYREVLVQEQADWFADPATLEEDYTEDHNDPLELEWRQMRDNL